MKNTVISFYTAYDGNKNDVINLIEKLEKCDSSIELHILCKGISEIEKLSFSSSSIKCHFDDVSEFNLDNIDYYKFAILKLSKGGISIFIDACSKIELDINRLLNVKLGDYYVGAYHDLSFDGEILSRYCQDVLGFSHYLYTSDDFVVFDIDKLKANGAYERFCLYKDFCSFSLSPSEALFNLTFKDRILLIGDVESGTADTGALAEIENENSFLNKWNREKRAQDRVSVVNKIADFEKNGIFDQDVEDDVPGRMIMPDEIEYVKKTMAQKLKAKIAFSMAKRFYYKLEKKKMVMINDEVDGLENLAGLDTGAVITCNHFNAMDSFAMHWVYLKSKQRKRKLYRVIREGNYTSFPGFFGFLMRNFYTLPLSSNHKTMRKFMDGVNELLQGGQFVLVYPEQSMWWTYRKPKPLKPGAFSFASKNNVPVLPIFISMRDSGVLGPDGYYVQEYKMHIGKPIFPDSEKNSRENVDYMMKENERVWKEIYEREYQMPLEYTTEENTSE